MKTPKDTEATLPAIAQIPINLEGWLEALKTERGIKNPVAVLALAAHVLAGQGATVKSVPRAYYGRVGALCKKMNDDYGYLMRLLWEASASRPAGDLVNYVEGILKKRASPTNSERPPQNLHERRVAEEKALPPLRKVQNK